MTASNALSGQQPNPPPSGGVRVEVSEVEGVFYLGLVALTLAIVLGIVVIRLSGRRGA